jgi:electron transfer flavoprotein alpha subunit
MGGEIHVLVAGTATAVAAAQQAATARRRHHRHGCRRRPLPEPDRREPDRPGGRQRRGLQPHPRPGHHLRQEPAAARRRTARCRADLRNHRRRSPDTFVRPIYAGNALATVQSADKIKVITVRTTAFDAVDAKNQPQKPKTSPPAPIPSPNPTQHRELTKSERPELGAAKIIVSGGRGLGSGENYHKPCSNPWPTSSVPRSAPAVPPLMPALCRTTTRSARPARSLRPQLYIAVGISGAIQHLAGMKESKVIVAINKDPDAPIFQVADYGLVGDLFELVPQLESAVG